MLTIDTRFVTLVPFIALGLAAAGILLHRNTARASGYGPWTYARRGSALQQLGIGVIGLCVGSSLFAIAQRDAGVYRTDPTCSAGFTLSSAGGACRVEAMRIVATYRTSGSRATSARTHLVLERGDASQIDVALGASLRGSVATGFRERNDRAATVQLFRDKAVLIDTTSGLSTTTDLPAQRANQWAIVGIVFGAFGVIGALVSALRAPPQPAY